MLDWEIGEKEDPDDDYEYGYEDIVPDEPEQGEADEADEGEWWNEEESQPDTEVDDVSEEYSEDALPDETAEQLLAMEHVMDKLKPFVEEVREETEPEHLRRMLKRELRQEALTRMEQAARTQQEFAAVVAVWNQLDENRQRKERYHEISRGPEMLEIGKSELGLIFPLWYSNPAVRQLTRGDFLDLLHDCPYLMHELSSKGSIRKAVNNLKEDHKELLFFLYLRLYTTLEVAALRGQSDRNIRKVRKTMLKKLRQPVYEALKKQVESGYRPSLRERSFLEDYEKSV